MRSIEMIIWTCSYILLVSMLTNGQFIPDSRAPQQPFNPQTLNRQALNPQSPNTNPFIPQGPKPQPFTPNNFAPRSTGLNYNPPNGPSPNFNGFTPQSAGSNHAPVPSSDLNFIKDLLNKMDNVKLPSVLETQLLPFNPLAPPLIPKPAQFNPQQASSNSQPLPFNPQRAPLNPRQAQFNPQQASFNSQSLPVNPQRAPLNPRPAQFNRQQAPFNPQSDPSNLPSTPFNPQLASFNPHPVPFNSPPVPLNSQPAHLNSQPINPPPSSFNPTPAPFIYHPSPFIQQLLARNTPQPTPSNHQFVPLNTQPISPVYQPAPAPVPANPQPPPIDIQPPPIDIQPPPIDTLPPSTDIQPPPMDTRPTFTNTQPSSTDTQASSTDTQPPTNTQPSSTDTQPPTNTQPSSTNAQTSSTNAQPSSTNAQPPTNTQPSSTNTQLSSTDTQPPFSGTQPAPIDSQTITLNTQPVSSDAQPTFPDLQPAPSETQPDVSNAQSTALPQSANATSQSSSTAGVSSAQSRSDSSDKSAPMKSHHGKNPLRDFRIVCIFNNQHYAKRGFNPGNIEPDLCTHINYEFAILDPKTYEMTMGEPDLDMTANLYQETVDLKKKNPELKIMLSLGGWLDSTKKYSEMVAVKERRTNFIEKAISFLKAHEFDGLDLAWEYPNCWQGALGVSPKDKNNFVALLKEMKPQFVKNGLLLSVSVGAIKREIEAAYDVPEVSKSVDYINVMTYDMHGPWEPVTGHHTQYETIPGDADPYLNVKGGMNVWVQKGANKKKLNLGLAFYAKTFTLKDPNQHGLGAPAIGIGRLENTTEAGFLLYNEICQYLNDGNWTEIEDRRAGFFAYSGDQWACYDPPMMVVRKAKFVVESGLGGLLIKDVSGDDYKGDCFKHTPFILLRMIRMQMVHQIRRQHL